MMVQKKLKNRLSFFIVAGFALLFTGCATSVKETKVGPSFFPAREAETDKPTEGSLWTPNNKNNFLFIDNKARALNDLVNVLIVESSSGSNAASTEGAKNSTASANVSNFFGLMESFRRSNRNVSPDSLFSSSFENNFTGSGTTSRSGTITANVQAVVREVLPNGYLYIEGSKEVTLNNETQLITVTGTVRPEDIRPGNTILSSLIADIRVKYTGLGFIANKQKPGVLSKVLDTIWPF